MTIKLIPSLQDCVGSVLSPPLPRKTSTLCNTMTSNLNSRRLYGDKQGLEYLIQCHRMPLTGTRVIMSTSSYNRTGWWITLWRARAGLVQRPRRSPRPSAGAGVGCSMCNPHGRLPVAGARSAKKERERENHFRTLFAIYVPPLSS